MAWASVSGFGIGLEVSEADGVVWQPGDGEQRGDDPEHARDSTTSRHDAVFRIARRRRSHLASAVTIRYDTIRDAILTCA